MKFFFAVICVYLSAQNLAHASHFRGGYISWAPVNPSVTFPVDKVDVLITTRFYWIMDGADGQCSSNADIAAQNLIGDTDFIYSENGDSWSVSTRTKCSDFSVSDGWSGGIRSKSPWPPRRSSRLPSDPAAG